MVNSSLFDLSKLLAICFIIKQVTSWCEHTRLQDKGPILCVDYSMDGRYLATTTATSVTVWTIDPYQIYHQFPVTNGQCAKFSQDNPTSKIAIGVTNRIYVHSVTSPFSESVPNWNPGVGNTIYDLQFDDDQYLLVCGSNNNIKVRKFNPTPTDSVSFSESNLLSCAFGNNREIVIARSDDKIELYPQNGGSRTWRVTRDDCTEVVVSSDAKRVLAACDQNDQYGILITKANTNNPDKQDLIQNGNQLLTVSYANDLDHFVFGGTDNILYIFDKTDELISKFIVSDDIIDSDFTHNSNFLVIGADNGIAYIYSRYCFSCDPGYYYDSINQICKDCWSDIHGCGSCSSSTICIECMEGYILNAGTFKCDDCQLNMAGCGSCLDANNCTYCVPGYYLDTSSSNYDCETCQSAIIGCYVCDSGSVCLQCESDYYLDTNDLCEPCTSVGVHCIKCLSSTQCAQCQIGFFVDSGVCTPCDINCYACQSLTNCTDCLQGYYTKNVGGNIVCQQCPYGCLACNATGHCTDCFDERFLTGGNCNLCSSPCSTCNDTATNCLSCIAGYFISGGVTCTICTYPCITCNASATSCLSCPPTYFLDSNVCKLCADNYANCSVCTGSQCSVCHLGYYLDNSVTPKVCVNCLNDIHGCISCNTSTNCLLCGEGYYHKGVANNGNDSCQICPLGCQSCYSAGNCTNCHNGFYLDTTSDTCEVCENKCIRCTSANDCLQCQLGYYISGTDCDPCTDIDSYCLSCATDIGLSSTVCLSCQIGTFYDTVNSKCDFCSEQCTACVTLNNCTACSNGRYLDISVDKCIECHQNCTQCTSSSDCVSCNSGFYLNSTNQCEYCGDVSCATCNSTTLECLSCKIGYYLDTSVVPNVCENCLKTIPDCSVCISNTICQLCSYGYALAVDQLSCSPCSLIEGCKHCLETTSCQNCEIGYFLVDDGFGNLVCSQCPAGCQACDNLGVCFVCQAQYTLVTPGSTCSLCSNFMKGCMQCSDNSNCQKCDSGYYINTTSNNCLLCSDSIFSCQYCTDNTTCEQCFDGFYLTTGNTCQTCNTDLFGCQLCNSSTVCLSCQFGFYLFNSQCFLCQNILPNCQYCLDSTTCKSCKSGSFMDGTSCSSCEAHIPGCILCDSSSDCLQCQGGYYIDSTTNKCVACALQGCQVCHESDPNKCIDCNSKFFYDSTAENCILCRNNLPGCLQCQDSTRCTVCQPGFFVNSTFDCEICQDSMNGCGRCESALICLQCKNMFYLQSNKCEYCQEVMPGCMSCLNNTECQTCWHGYYLSDVDKLCESCTKIDGCNSCLNQSFCLYCQPDYFLSTADNLCYPCSVMVGCYACVSNITCSVCSGGYIMNNNQLCSKMRVQAFEKLEQMKLVTLYVNETTLKHQLYAKGMSYNKIDTNSIDWTNTTNLLLEDSSYQQVDLVIKKVVWGQKDNLIIFYTNNPLNLTKQNYQMLKKDKQRLLLEGSLPDQFKVHLKMEQQVINKILPDFHHDQELVIDYDIDSPQFLKSYHTFNGQNQIDYVYAAFGISVTVILLIKYIIKAICTVPMSYQMGGIIPHVFAHKVPTLILYPTFIEFTSYCYGFMTADFPWANEDLGVQFGEESDNVPLGFLLVYINLNLGSTYFIASLIILIVGILVYVVYRSKQTQYKVKYAIGEVFINFFIFGITFAGCICIVGALENHIQSVTLNTVFYMLGIAVYSLVLGFITYSLYISKHNFNRLRVFFKASLLGFSSFSPIYIFSAAIFIDLVCILIEYCIGQKYHNKYPKCWIIKNILLDISISIMVFVPQIKLTIIITSALIGIAVIMDIVTHVLEYRNKESGNFKNISALENTENANDNNIWNISFEKDKKQTLYFDEPNYMEGTKTTFNNTKGSEFSNQYVSRRNKFKRHKKQRRPDVLQIIEASGDNDGLQTNSVQLERSK